MYLTLTWDELSCILAIFRIILRWLYVVKLGLFLPTKPPVLLGILMQPVHSLWPFSSLKDASRYRVEFWKKVLRWLWTRKSIIRLMCRKRATLSVLELRLGVSINLVYFYKCDTFYRNRIKGSRVISIWIFKIDNVWRAIATLIYIKKWSYFNKNYLLNTAHLHGWWFNVSGWTKNPSVTVPYFL
jgi:hypothetical protein